jgi:hypothetical protein
MADEAFDDGLTYQPIVLDPQPEPGGVRRSRAPQPLADRVRFGGPLFTPIDSRYLPEDQDFQALVAGATDKRFLLATISVDFPPSDEAQLADAIVEVALRDDAEPSEVIAYQLIPLTAGTQFEVTRTYSLKPSIKVGPVGVDVNGQTASVDHGERTYLNGGGELTANPSWTFTPTKTQKLEGPNRLRMLIQIPRERTGTMSVTIRATVGGGRFWKRRVPLQGAPADARGRVQF